MRPFLEELSCSWGLLPQRDPSQEQGQERDQDEDALKTLSSSWSVPPPLPWPSTSTESNFLGLNTGFWLRETGEAPIAQQPAFLGRQQDCPREPSSVPAEDTAADTAGATPSACACVSASDLSKF